MGGDKQALSLLEGYKRRDLAYLRMISIVDNIPEKEARKKASYFLKRSEGTRKAINRYYHEALREYYTKQRKPGRMRIIEEIPPERRRPVPPVPVAGISELERLRKENTELKAQNQELIDLLKSYRARLERVEQIFQEGQKHESQGTDKTP
jgi:hypothetical protein